MVVVSRWVRSRRSRRNHGGGGGGGRAGWGRSAFQSPRDTVCPSPPHLSKPKRSRAKTRTPSARWSGSTRLAATDSADTTTRVVAASAATCRRGRVGLTAEAASSSRASHRPGHAAGTDDAADAVVAARALGEVAAAAAAGGGVTAAVAPTALCGRRRSRAFHGLPSIGERAFTGSIPRDPNQWGLVVDIVS